MLLEELNMGSGVNSSLLLCTCGLLLRACIN